MADAPCRTYAFGPFRLDAGQHTLTRAGAPIEVPPRAFDLLLALVRRDGALATKAELLDEVWRDVIVEEGNLTQTVFVLRRLLGPDGERLIVTVPRRGYRLGMPVTPLDDTGDGPATTPAHAPGDPGAAPSRHRRARALMMAAVASVIATIGALAWSLGPGARTRDAAPSATPPLVPRRLVASTDVTGAALSPDGRFVAYTRQERTSSVWLLQLLTGREVEVAAGADETVAFPSFSADGEFLYAVRQRPNGSSELAKMPVLGGSFQPLAANVSSAAAAAPDGRRLAFVRWTPAAGLRSVVVLDLGSGREQVVLERRSPAVITYGGLAWSRDGRRVTAVVNESFGGAAAEAVEVDVDSRQSRRVTAALPWRSLGVARLCDESSLLLNAGPLFRLGPGPGDIARLTLDTGFYRSVTTRRDCGAVAAVQENQTSTIWVKDGVADARPRKHLAESGFDHGLSWFPDGRLAYESETDGNPDVWVLDRDGRQRTRLTNAEGIDGFPAVSPDGRVVVFASGREGGSAIWRMNADGSDQRRLSPPGAAYAPDVSPDGRFVVYHAADPAMSWRTWRIPIEGGTPAPLTDGASTHAVHSPDGRWIACNLLVRGGARDAWMIAVVPASGGSPARVIGVEGPPTRRLAWMPDGGGVLYSNPGDVVRLAPADGSPPRVFLDAEGETVIALAWSRDGRRLAFVRHQRSSSVVLFEMSGAGANAGSLHD